MHAHAFKSEAKGELKNPAATLKPVTSRTLRLSFSPAPEGTAALFFIVSRLLPAALDRYLGGLTGHVARPSRAIRTTIAV